MTCSLAVTVRTPRLRDRMLRYLDGCFRTWTEITGEDEECCAEPLEGMKPCVISFEGLVLDGKEHAYLFAVSRWIALRIGRKRRSFPMGLCAEAVPYCVVDHELVVPVFTKELWPRIQGKTLGHRHVVDPYGCPLSRSYLEDMAWHHIPSEAYTSLAVTHKDHPVEALRAALVKSGLERAKATLQVVQAEVTRLDVLWAEGGLS